MRGLLTLTWVELKLFARDPLAMVFSLAFPIGVMLILPGLFKDEPDREAFRGAVAIDYYTPAYMGLIAASLGLIGLPVPLAAYRELGVLRRFRASSVPVWAVFVSQVLVGVAVAVLGSGLLVALGVVMYGLSAPQAPVGVAVAFAVSLLSFAAVGLLLAAVLSTTRAAQAAGMLLFFTMMFLSGADGPRALMPGWLHRSSEVLLLTHVVAALQDPWLGFGWNAGELLVTGAMGVVSAALALRLFRWD